MRLKPRNPLAAFYYARPEKYRLVRDAMLECLRPTGSGDTLEELVRRIALMVPFQHFPSIASIRWYTLVVRIDLEARGLIRRIPRTRPLRFLRAPMDVAASAESEVFSPASSAV
jgi:hypothetical protein